MKETQVCDLEIEKIIKTLLECPLSGYYIASKTGITEQTIINYRNRKTIPTKANAKLLEYFFSDETVNKRKTVQSIVGDGNKLAGNNIIENEKFDCIITDLKKQIEYKDNIINSLIKHQEILLSQIEKLTKKK